MHVMESLTSATRGRTPYLAQNSKSCSQGQQSSTVNRWIIYKQLCVAKSEFGLNDRCLAVLSSLLSFLPGDDLNEKNGLVVFPSNRQLSLRAHGMAESTLRRHLSALINSGIIERKDSPTRKRYAHKDNEGDIELAFGFSLSPLLARAADIAKTAARIAAAAKALKRLRDEVSVLRREIAAQFPIDNALDQPASLSAIFLRFRSIVDAIPRRASHDRLGTIKAELEAILRELSNHMKDIDKTRQLSVDAAQIERQHNESLPESLLESKNINLNDLKEDPSPLAKPSSEVHVQTRLSVPLDLVLRCCPDIRAYATKGISSWRDLFDAARVVASFFGISDHAYRDAIQVLGRDGVSASIAWILQRAAEIRSPGGYLRTLTQKAGGGAFSLSALFMPGVSQYE
ncbi:replication initiation protein [Brucella sp. NBRC 12950]|nr:replication initiation protein [Brucella sp. NBRC 12950]